MRFNRCPSCGKGVVFRGFLSMNQTCPSCGHRFEKEPGFFLGASVVAYFVGAFSLVPTLVVCLLGFNLDLPPTLAIGTAQMLIFTPLLYRYSRLIWLHTENRMTQRLESSDFKDLFSGHSDGYAKFRPTYPRSLFDYLSSLCHEHACAWDCGTGNGQGAVALAATFERVVATDPSEQQLKNAALNPRVEYRLASAEKSGLNARSVDLVTVAQAFHWFNQPGFFQEVGRVAKSGAVLALWSYSLCEITPEIDRLVEHLYSNVLDAYWEPERALVECGYRTVKVPFGEELSPPEFKMTANWSLEHLIGYLNTWSALQSFIKKNQRNPLDDLIEPLRKAWGSASTREIRWPLSVRVFRLVHG